MNRLQLSVIKNEFASDLTINTVTNSSAQLYTTTTQSITTSQSSFDPSRMARKPVSGICVKQEHFEEETALPNHQQFTEYPNSCPLSPLSHLVSTVTTEEHSVANQLPPHSVIETVQYDPNIAIKQEQCDQSQLGESVQIPETVNQSIELCPVLIFLSGTVQIFNSTPLLMSSQLLSTAQSSGIYNQQVYDHDYMNNDGTSNNKLTETLQINRIVNTQYFKSLTNQHNIVDPSKVEEVHSNFEDSGCTQYAVKRVLNFERMDTERAEKRQRSEQINYEFGVIRPNTNEGGDESEVNEQCRPNGDDDRDGQLSTDAQVDEGDHPDQINAIQQQVDIDANNASAVQHPSRNNIIHAARLPGTKFKCYFPGCIKEYRQKRSLVCHARDHTGEKPFKCSWDRCDKSFARSTHLQTHMRGHTGQTGERLYVCDRQGCNSAFARPAHLRDHILTHTGERPHACEYLDCGARFVQKSQLNDHYKRMHNRL